MKESSLFHQFRVEHRLNNYTALFKQRDGELFLASIYANRSNFESKKLLFLSTKPLMKDTRYAYAPPTIGHVKRAFMANKMINKFGQLGFKSGIRLARRLCYMSKGRYSDIYPITEYKEYDEY